VSEDESVGERFVLGPYAAAAFVDGGGEATSGVKVDAHSFGTVAMNVGKEELLPATPEGVYHCGVDKLGELGGLILHDQLLAVAFSNRAATSRSLEA
jgi:hypothetical protein